MAGNDSLERARANARHAFEDALKKTPTLKMVPEEILEVFHDALFDLDADVDAEVEALEAEFMKRLGQGSAGTTKDEEPTRKPRPTVDNALLTSPFRFVALNEHVVPPEDHVRTASLAEPLAGGVCARLSVTWEAETPLLVGEERSEKAGAKQPVDVAGPMRLGPGGPYTIPGATLRGCLRAAMEIVAGGRLGQINAHHRYGLRDFDHPSIRRSQSDSDDDSLLARRNVRAGWLRRRAGADGYEIIPCRDWKTIAIVDLPFRNLHDDDEWRLAWLKTNLEKRYQMAGVPFEVVPKRRGMTAMDFGSAPVGCFILMPSNNSVGELRVDDNGPIRGTFVFSNSSPAPPRSVQDLRQQEQIDKVRRQQKKREYVFLDDEHAKPFPVPPAAWERFTLINTRPAKNRREPDGSWKVLAPSLELPDGRLPVFFIGDPTDGEQFQFGLTRFFKIAHKFSVGDMRDRSARHRRARVARAEDFAVDFVEALFGYVYEKDDVFTAETLTGRAATAPQDLARRGRIAVGFATVSTDTAATETEILDTVMGVPRASFAPFYLAGRFKDYSSEESDTRLAGRKRYLARYPNDRAQQAETALRKRLRYQITRLRTSGTQVSERILSRLRFLVPAQPGRPLAFQGDIRLHNVSAAELGAVLWVLTHGAPTEKRYRHLIGRAKPFGAGQMRVKALTLSLQPNDKAAMDLVLPAAPAELPEPNAKREGWLTPDSRSMAPFLSAFANHMRTYRPDWPQVPDVAEYLATADPSVGAHIAGDTDETLIYPALKDFNRIREFTKLSNRHVDPTPGPDRFLPAQSGK